MNIKEILIILAAIILIWIIFGGVFQDHGNSYGPDGIEDYNSSPSNPYGA